MKRSIFIVFALAFGLFACAQTPPKVVSDSFNKKFAKAKKVEWDQEESNEWEAEFKMNSNEMSACFDNKGNWLATETEITEKDLPTAVLKAVEKTYPEWEIELVEKIENLEFKGYEIAIEKEEKELEILLTADGKITVNKETEEEDENDEK